MIKNKVVYVHRRLTDNSVFYVGMGNPSRPFQSSKASRTSAWHKVADECGYSVEIIGRNLSVEEGNLLEIMMIARYGVSTIESGTLVNVRKGGKCSTTELRLKQYNAVIASMQRKYYASGDFKDVLPMTISDIAYRVHLDKSSVSRYVKGMKVDTPHGKVLITDLISEKAIKSIDGRYVSQIEIMSVLKNAILSEDKYYPLNDKAMVGFLRAKGYIVARRTVAKYRDALGFNIARKRKIKNN